MTTIALFGAGGKMGYRLASNLRGSRFEVRHVEVSPAGQERLKKGLGFDCVPAEQARHRRTLCSIMEASGFARYDREWWHYALRDEPYPDRYFDFPISR